MSNVVNIEERQAAALRRQRTGTDSAVPQRPAGGVKGAELFRTYTPVQPPAEALEQSLDEYRATMLAVAHKRQAFELQMMLETNAAQIKLEAAGYKAMLAGVPENDIYALGEDMAEALSSAMETVAGA